MATAAPCPTACAAAGTHTATMISALRAFTERSLIYYGCQFTAKTSKRKWGASWRADEQSNSESNPDSHGNHAQHLLVDPADHMAADHPAYGGPHAGNCRRQPVQLGREDKDRHRRDVHDPGQNGLG